MTERIDTQALLERVDLLDLIGRDVVLKKVAGTRGGEYAGPCPFCRTGRDRMRVWPDWKYGRFWCRACGTTGDAISYIVARDDVGFVQACQMLGAAPARATRVLAPSAPPGTPPPPGWQAKARAFIERCERTLWTPRGKPALDYLHGRGLEDHTLQTWRVGYHPVKATAAGNQWGLPEVETVYLPKGVMLPWTCGDEVWQVKVRSLDAHADPRYQSVTGGHPDLFGSWTMAGHDAVILTEGEFDCLLVWQVARAAGIEIGTASLGSASARPSSQRLAELRALRRVLIAYDADTEGERAASVLMAGLPNAWRMPPTNGKDVTEFYLLPGTSLKSWLWAWTCWMEELAQQRAAEGR